MHPAEVRKAFFKQVASWRRTFAILPCTPRNMTNPRAAGRPGESGLAFLFQHHRRHLHHSRHRSASEVESGRDAKLTPIRLCGGPDRDPSFIAHDDATSGSESFTRI